MRRLAAKRGLLPSAPIDKLGTMSYPHVVGGHEDGVICKEGNAPDGFTAGAMDIRADCGLSEENTQGEGDPKMMGLEDITAEAREIEFDWLRSSDPQLQDTAAYPPPDPVRRRLPPSL
jgi:hypothetical protein